jgi:SAM-dependent MidA family methyltransferase
LLTPDVQLPAPDPAAAAHSDAVVKVLRDAIGSSAAGWIDFERYMDIALYEPGLGYYAAGAVKLGEQGDFVTAPELTPLFGKFVARQIAPVLRQLDHPQVLELGPGSGALAAAVLPELERLGQSPEQYWLLEPSPDLRQRQGIALAPWQQQTRWLDRLPTEPFEGVVIANEVVDALPVARFQVADAQVLNLGVAWDDGFRWQARPADNLQGLLPLPTLAAGTVGEWCPRLAPWLAAVTAPLARGMVLLMDYGLPSRAYYHPDHPLGRLVCHYRHRRHEDPFWWPGLCDISAWVDFSALARAGSAAGLDLAGFTTQAQWLVEGGLDQLMGNARPADLAAIKTLLLPGEMGEAFKVMAFSRGLDIRVPGRDLRDRL